MTWVKICGITSLEDAKVAVNAGADALGFVFYEKSPRKIAVDAAREIVSELPAEIEKVGVFVQGGLAAAAIVRRSGLSAMQATLQLNQVSDLRSLLPIGGLLHSPKSFLSFSADWFLKNRAELLRELMLLQNPGQINPAGIAAIFLDSSTPGRAGGTGKTFDWDKAVSVAEQMRESCLKLVVAGGLTPENVTEAMRILKPWGVDVSSGVEAVPGKKDPTKVREFIAAVRKADGGA
jgi:phosphoribosylanthranilate isomerase